MLSIGIGGNIGSGKTAVAKELCKLCKKDGVRVNLLDADQTAWELYKRNAVSEKRSAVYDKIIKAFGTGVLDNKGEIDRKKLGKIVFNNRKALQQLNMIVHPELIRQIKHELRKFDGTIKILDAALLFFWGKKIPVTYRVLVISPDKQKVVRMAKRGYNIKEVNSRLNQQMKESEMEKITDFVVNNNSTLNELKNKVKYLYLILKEY